MALERVQRHGNNLRGAERAAVLLLALGGDGGKNIFSQLEESEIRDISSAMSRLGTVSPAMMEDLIVDFVTKISAKGSLSGNAESTERLLGAFLPGERVNAIMEEIRGPAGRNMWEKLSNVPENILANYLKNEYPQTVAVVLSKIRSDHASRVLNQFAEDFALEVIGRMLRMESVQKDVLEKVEQTLRTELMSNLSHTSRRDSHELMAEIFNNFDRADRSAVHDRAGGAQPRRRRPHQGADVHVRRLDQARRRERANAAAHRREG